MYVCHLTCIPTLSSSQDPLHTHLLIRLTHPSTHCPTKTLFIVTTNDHPYISFTPQKNIHHHQHSLTQSLTPIKKKDLHIHILISFSPHSYPSGKSGASYTLSISPHQFKKLTSSSVCLRMHNELPCQRSGGREVELYLVWIVQKELFWWIEWLNWERIN